jgi:hypothetical protein
MSKKNNSFEQIQKNLILAMGLLLLIVLYLKIVLF